MPMTKAEQVECLRRYGHEKEAGMLERGEVAAPPPDAFDTSWACLKLSDALSALADGLKAPHWSVTIRSKYGDTSTVTVQAASEAEAAFLAGRRTLIPGAELVSVEAAG